MSASSDQMPGGSANGIPEYGLGVKNSIEAFRNSLPLSQTAVRIIDLDNDGCCDDRVLNDNEFELYLKDNKSTKTATLFINRFLTKASEPWPHDANKLQLSQPAFDSLRSRYQLSPSFLNALANIQHASPRNIPRHTADDDFVIWFFVPARIQFLCLNAKAHTSRSKGKSQMNPLNYLHLNHSDVDIRGSKIAVYYLFSKETNQVTSIVFNFQDGRWKKAVDEPILRLRDIYRGCESAHRGRDPVYVQMVILSSVLRWWNNSLNNFNDQLIAHEEGLIRQDLTNEDLPQLNADTNHSLHCMAAHLHRYYSELRLLSDILQDINSCNRNLHNEFVAYGLREASTFGFITTALDQASSYLAAICLFRDELQQKIDNVLALLVDNNQAMSNRLLVRNSRAMQAILQATQAEASASRHIAIQSQKLAEGMVRDSGAMRMVALLATFFLPGTSFAAILAIPFFNQSTWLNGSGRIWIWLALTLPSTILCFWLYRTWNRRLSKKVAVAYNIEMLVQGEASSTTLRTKLFSSELDPPPAMRQGEL